jgi:hypothetical protein
LASLWTDKKIAVVNSAGRLQIKKGPNPYNLAEKLLPPEGALYGTDLVDVRIFDQVREQDLVLYESPLAIGYVELAPMFPFEACMSILRWGASSRLFLTEEEKAEERKVVNFILERYRRIGVQQLNITDEAAWVGDRTTLWRYTLRFSPRMVDDRIVRVGTPQLDDCFIVPVAPREAAIKLRNTI